MIRIGPARLFVLGLAMCAATPAFAADAPAPTNAPAAAAAAAAPAPADDKAVVPFIDEGTFVVIRFDVDRVDHDAFEKWAATSIDVIIKSAPFPPDAAGQVKAMMMGSVNTAKAWMTDMTEAGGKRLYVLFDTADEADDVAPVVVVPKAAGADAERIRAQFPASAQHSVHEIGDALVYATGSQAERLKKRFEPGAAPVERADLAAALAAGGAPDAPAHVALVPGESARKWVEENLPQLPEALGGGETKLLSRGVKWASVAVTQKPQAQARLTIRAENAEQAKPLFDALNKGSEWLRQQLEHLPQGGEMVEAMDASKLKLDGQTITANVDPVLVQMAMMGMQMRAEGAEVRAEVEIGPDGKPVEPAKKKTDDGGL